MFAAHTSGGVQRQHVEAHQVPRLQRPAEDREVFTMLLDLRQVGQCALGKPFGLIVHERARHKPRSLVRSRDELQGRRSAHWVHRNPEADVVGTRDVVVGLVLMPRRALSSVGFFDQDVIVVQTDLPAAEQTLGDCRQGGVVDHAAVMLIFLPVAEVFEEPARVIGAARHLGAGAGLRKILLDAFPELFNLRRGQGIANAHGPMLKKVALGDVVQFAGLKVTFGGCEFAHVVTHHKRRS